MSSSEPWLAVESLSAAWGATPVLRSVSLAVAPGEYFVLLGPNGSGKTTLLRCIAGLERPTEGRVLLDRQDVTDTPPHRRGIGLMFQEPALFPHRTVFENIAYAPLLQRRERPEVEAVVGQMVELLHLGGFEDRTPAQLSGGERHRVALARTLAARPRFVLLDEPFASIDPELKQELRTDFRRALTALGIAAIHVTHDREEGLFLADRLGLLFAGSLESVGTPDEVFGRPRTALAARFLGYNVLSDPSGAVAVHPTDVTLRPDGGGPLSLTVEAAGTVGRESVVLLRTDDGERVEARLAAPGAAMLPGRRVSASWERSLPLTTSEVRDPSPKSPRTRGL